MAKPEKFDHLHLVYHVTGPLNTPVFKLIFILTISKYTGGFGFTVDHVYRWIYCRSCTCIFRNIQIYQINLN